MISKKSSLQVPPRHLVIVSLLSNAEITGAHRLHKAAGSHLLDGGNV
jgi:hypothetical protein